ncbi:uncharacterized protein LOC116111819 [Pistacia vera]|uniref:uncharacterized protein LOC116111819 n=1 Tax=Pistacia vera TaxID=55513 RepID=UPI001263C860|nr:uncharacterized protein LOC116111819 [Pistacia vera]
MTVYNKCTRLMGEGGNETAMIVLGSQLEAYSQRGVTILVLFQVRRMASTFTIWRVRLLHFLSNHCNLQALKVVLILLRMMRVQLVLVGRGCFDIGEDDEGSSSPRSVSFKTKKLEGVREGIQGKLALYHVIPFLSMKSF